MRFAALLLFSAAVRPVVAIEGWPTFTWAEVGSHATKSSCWIVVRGAVFDVTKWLQNHPGGEAPLMKRAGGDATEAFQRLHSNSQTAHQKIGGFLLGVVSNATNDTEAFLQKVVGDRHQYEENHDLKAYTMEEVALHNTRESCWIVIQGVVVDATEFLDKHPGGAKRILGRAGQNATEQFDRIGHSETAQELTRYYAIGYISTMSGAPDVRAIIQAKQSLSLREIGSDFWTTNFPLLSRLNTGIDKKHVHKLLGISAIVNWGVRACVLIANRFEHFTMTNPTPLNVATLAIHMALPVASLQFEVPKVKKEFFIIFQSYQLEVIWFTLKYASATVLRWYSPAGNDRLLKLAHVILTHGIVDLSNWLFRLTENGTPVRGRDDYRFLGIWSEWDMRSWERVFHRTINHLAPMLSQTLAVMASLDMYGNSVNQDAVTEIMFWSLLPIQGHAFSLTLVRKGIIDDGFFKKFLYFLMLFPGTRLALKYGDRVTFTCTFTYMFLRCMTPAPKYGIYVAFVAAVIWMTKKPSKTIKAMN
mmetsp:Transcript_44556/g.80073  ORF Transcript_44556/g.80073 Transcript_44556/m.80073 type:complete len:531 (+) Transcript_44556:56-1648(+)